MKVCENPKEPSRSTVKHRTLRRHADGEIVNSMGYVQTTVEIKKPIVGLAIGRMRESDLQGVVEIERQSFSDPWGQSSFRQGVKHRNPHVHFFVARHETCPIAFINFWLIKDEAHIANFAVALTYRRLGVGKYLFAQSLEYIRHLGGQIVTLEVRAGNTPAQNLYRQFGFKDVGMRRKYYRDNGEDAYIFRLSDLSCLDLVIDSGTEQIMQ